MTYQPNMAHNQNDVDMSGITFIPLAGMSFPLSKLSFCRTAFLAGAFLTAIPLSGITTPVAVNRTDTWVSVDNGLWRLWLTKDQGWDISKIENIESGLAFHGHFFNTYLRPKTHRVHNNGMPGESPVRAGLKDKVHLEFEGEGSDRVKMIRTWSSPVGMVEEHTTFDPEARRFQRRVILKAEHPVAELYIESRCTDKPVADHAIFFPEEKRISGPSPYFTAGMPYIEAHSPETGMGFGMQPTAGAPRMGRFAFGDAERGDDKHPLHAGRNYAGITLNSPLLSYHDIPAEYSLEFVGFMTVGNQRPIEVSSPDIELIEAWPRKMIARPDEGNTLEVVFRNNTNEERPVHLEIVLRHGIETTISLVDTQISLHPGASTQRQVKVNTSGLLYGAEVVTTLSDLTSGIEDQISEFFTVFDGYYRVSPLMAIENVGGARGVLAKNVINIRRGYAGVTEIYNWPRNSLFDMTPDTDWYLGGPYYFVSWSREYLKAFIAEAHRNGLGVVSWAQAMIDISDAMEYPQYLQYTAEGQFLSDRHHIFQDGAQRTQGVLPPGPVENMAVSVNFGIPEVSRQWGREMAASCQMFDWDGVRFDGPAPRFVPGSVTDPLKWKPETEANSFDFEGNPLTRMAGEETDGLSLRNMRTWLEEARKGNPRFELGMNIGHGINGDSGAEVDERRTSLALWRKSLTYAGEQQPMWLHEGALGITHPDWNTWESWTKKLMDLFRVTQELGGVCTVGHLRGLPPGPDRARSFTAFASGHRLAYTGSEEHHIFGREKFHAAEFAVRFGEFLFAPDYQLLPADQEMVSVEGHERLLWKDFVRRRVLESGKVEWVVHIVNRPRSDLIAVNDPFPPARKDTVVRFPLPDRQRVTGAWTLVPQPPRALHLKYQVANGSVIVRVPEIDAFASILLQAGE